MFTGLINILIVNAVKSSVRSSLRIDELTNKLKSSCPNNIELQKIIDQKNQLYNALVEVQSTLINIVNNWSTSGNNGALS